MSLPTPGSPAPELNVDLVGGGSFKLADADPQRFTMLVFYRGRHCPVCKTYLRELSDHLGAFADAGVDIVAISMDDEERAASSVEDWNVQRLSVGYGLTEEAARAWGLFISTAIDDGEPARFSEPGLFLVDPDGVLFYAAVNSMPWGRPDIEEVVKSLRWVEEHDHPSRGRAT